MSAVGKVTTGRNTVLELAKTGEFHIGTTPSKGAGAAT
jgi:hypothetical protein